MKKQENLPTRALSEKIIVVSKHEKDQSRARSPRRVAFDFSDTTSRTEQHTGDQNDVNKLVAKYSVPELDLYLASKAMQRQPIYGIDMTKEPTLQDAMNEVAKLKRLFGELPDHVKGQFKSVTDFLKFVDNPQNRKAMEQMGLITLIEKATKKEDGASGNGTHPSPKTTETK